MWLGFTVKEVYEYFAGIIHIVFVDQIHWSAEIWKFELTKFENQAVYSFVSSLYIAL